MKKQLNLYLLLSLIVVPCTQKSYAQRAGQKSGRLINTTNPTVNTPPTQTNLPLYKPSIATITPVGSQSPLRVHYRTSSGPWAPANANSIVSPHVETTIENDLAEGMECGTIQVETEAGSFNQLYVAGTESFAAKIIPGVTYDINEIQTAGNYLELSSNQRLPLKLYVNEPQGHTVDQVTIKPRSGQKIISTADLNSAVGKIMESAHSNLAAHSSITVESIFSEEQLALKVGLGGSYLGSSASAELGYSSNSSSWWYMVDLIDPYFTISVETAPKGLYAKNVSTESSWGFMRSVTYGRRAILLIETTEDLSKTSASFEAEISNLVSSVDVSMDLEMQQALETAKYSAYIYGGSKTYADRLLGAASSGDISAIQEAFSNYLERGGTDTKDAKPLSYELADLDGNTIVAESDVFSRDVAKCSPITRNYEITLDAIEVVRAGDAADSPEYLELYGRVGFSAFDAHGKEVRAEEHVAAEEQHEEINAHLPPNLQTHPDFSYVSFAYKDNYIKIKEGETEDNLNSIVRSFEMPIYEDDAYFYLHVDATDHDALSSDDEYGKISSPKIKVKDLLDVNSQHHVVVRDGNDEINFYFTIEKIFD